MPAPDVEAPHAPAESLSEEVHAEDVRSESTSTYEQERGKPLPSLNHGHLQFLISLTFGPYRDKYTVASELTLQLGNVRLTPDLCVFRKRKITFAHDTTQVSEPPLLAVEIVSPSQSTQDVADKIHVMLDAGVESCWLVQPAMQTITVYTNDAKPRTLDRGTLTDPATDIEVSVDALFSGE
ncbi:MAG: Uma2 family endonuclease [Longimonas sp.]|uniref:Uma2 family endonuclease n=1 Tax=Longimonas sp. TaxID=2039626 RepID=UPI00335B24E8